MHGNFNTKKLLFGYNRKPPHKFLSLNGSIYANVIFRLMNVKMTMMISLQGVL